MNAIAMPIDTKEILSPLKPGESSAESLADRWQRIIKLQNAYIVSRDSANLMTLTVAVVISPLLIDAPPPLWLWFVDSPSTGKSDTLRRVYGLKDHVVFRDELTANAMSSGYRENRKRARSLLDSLDKKALVTADLASLLSKDEGTVKSFLGTMTAAFDGTYDKSTGTDIEGPQHHEALFAWLAATTKASLPNYTDYMGQMGPRVLFYRPAGLTPEERKIAQNATRDPGRSALKRELTERVHRHVLELTRHPRVPTLSGTVENHVDTFAELLCFGRGVIAGLEANPEIEGPGRATLQLRSLAICIAMTRGHADVDQEDISLVRQVVMGSLDPHRAFAIQYLSEHPEGGTVAGLAEEFRTAGLSRQSESSALRDLCEVFALGLATKEGSKYLPSRIIKAAILGGHL